MTVHKQRQAMLIAAVLTALAAMLGLVFATLVSGGMSASGPPAAGGHARGRGG